jgi:hypothetical protein
MVEERMNTIAERIKTFPLESINIFPGEPNEMISTKILDSVPEAKEETFVYRFCCPTGKYLILTTRDLICFMARNSKQEIINGSLSIYLNHQFNHWPDKSHEKVEIYKGTTGIVIPQYGCIVIPGETLDFYFLHPTEKMIGKQSQLTIHANYITLR